MTNGNAGTLDALNRGEIWMGAVWIDQLVAWKNEGRMAAAVTPVLPAPGLPIYPLYLVVPREAAQKETAVRYVDYIATPEVQAKAIVERFGWYPGVDPEKVLGLISPKSPPQRRPRRHGAESKALCRRERVPVAMATRARCTTPYGEQCTTNWSCAWHGPPNEQRELEHEGRPAVTDPTERVSALQSGVWTPSLLRPPIPTQLE